MTTVIDVATLLHCTREPDSTHVVTMWVIPDGHRYDRAYVAKGFFSADTSSQELMQSFLRKYGQVPEMATVHTIEQEDAIQNATIS